ncbi:hypothetical protein pdam_00024917 [Pocillopora damicornis]|uniref:Uncharacterized protein n=1 Tax=Pocillopora damicornis TaxID=46731 RepID=A0A3M6TUV6_POCDA|nr:hypothetical protein pdam_00024917 [Pocillopora damicornis]
MRLFKFARLIIRFYGLKTLIFLSSSLNRVIYFWRMRHIRRGIIDVLWNLFRKRHPSRCIYNRSSNIVLANN